MNLKLTYKIIIFSALILFLANCRNKVNPPVVSTDDSIAKLKDSIAIELNSLNDLERNNKSLSGLDQALKIELSNKLFKLYEKSSPIDKPLMTGMKATFYDCYKKGINTTISSINIKVKLNNVLAAINLPIIKDSVNTLVGFYYVLAPVEALKDSSFFSYVIAKSYKIHDSVLNYDTIIPVSVRPDGKFLMVSRGNTMGKLITSDQFREYVQNYIKTIRFLDHKNANTNPYYVKDFFHPMISYHSAPEFYQFYNDNLPNIGQDTNVMITFIHGAIDIDLNIINRIIGWQPLDMYCQSPILIFTKDTIEYFKRHIDSTPRYLNQGLNVGRLCPPECD